MCEHCLTTWGNCNCPTEDAYISQCSCAAGVYCDLCGHYPKKSDEQSNQAEKKEK